MVKNCSDVTFVYYSGLILGDFHLVKEFIGNTVLQHLLVFLIFLGQIVNLLALIILTNDFSYVF